MSKALWKAVGLIALALAVAGAVLPLLPTTPFLLVAAWAFAKGSPRLHDWLIGHDRFGPLIRNWQTHRAISRPAKRGALLSMVVVLGGSVLLGVGWPVLAIQCLAMAGSAAFILTRPDGPRPG